MLEIILPGIVMFIVFFILNMAFGFVKDKECVCPVKNVALGHKNK